MLILFLQLEKYGAKLAIIPIFGNPGGVFKEIPDKRLAIIPGIISFVENNIGLSVVFPD